MKAAVKTKAETNISGRTPMLWTYYRVTWTFLTRLCSSVPADPEVIKKWLTVREARVKPAGALSIEEINEEVLASIERGEGEPDQSFNMLVFQRAKPPFGQRDVAVDGQLVMRNGTIRAHMKECSRHVSSLFIGKIQGERSFAQRVINGVYPDESKYWVPVLRETGRSIDKADGAFDKAIHVRGPRGEQLNALKCFEYIEPPSRMEFTLKVLGRSVSETDLHHLFTYGGVHGYAGERGDGEGRYSYTIERIDA